MKQPESSTEQLPQIEAQHLEWTAEAQQRSNEPLGNTNGEREHLQETARCNWCTTQNFFK